MREIEFNLDENPFINFPSARYAMSARVNVEKLWNWCHENDKSFFVMSLGCLINAYVLLPFYANAFEMPIDALIAMGTAVNPAINSLLTFVMLAVAPFNLLKGVLVSLITFLLYKRISRLVKGAKNGL